MPDPDLLDTMVILNSKKTTFIGAHHMTPFSLLEELLRYHTVRASETQQLSSMSHDEICRIIQDKLDQLLNSFEKYRHISYMVQGPRDNGVDVLLKSSQMEDEPEKYFALQVKSHKEVEDRDNGITQKLKAGWVDAQNSYGNGLTRYYILLFGDAVKHERRISAITNEFSKLKRVRVIGPRHLMAFLDMPQSTVAAIVDRHLSEEDYVRKQARREAASYRPMNLFFLLTCICWALENSTDILPEDFFEDDYRMEELKKRFGDMAVVRCLDRSSDTDFESYAEPYSRRIRLEDFSAIRALYYDLQVRYKETPDDLFNHLYEFLKEESDDRSEASEVL